MECKKKLMSSSAVSYNNKSTTYDLDHHSLSLNALTLDDSPNSESPLVVAPIVSSYNDRIRPVLDAVDKL